MNPPLYSGGEYYGKPFGIELWNKGFASVKIRSVLVNAEETPERVDFGSSNSLRLVLGEELDKNPSITFHKIDDYKINPEYSSKELKDIINKNDRTKSLAYGLRIYYGKPIEKIIIKYTYLGIPFTYEIEVKKL